ncbi:MAG: hypothetical protein WDA75_03335 [Candidatus Latescibacterota bacterium]|jgi:hypothetical protein
MLDQVIGNLSAADQPTVLLHLPGGARLLVLPFGGRVLSLCPPDSDQSFLWLNPALTNPQTAASYLQQDGWRNPGGDRTWVAPEIDLFVADLGRPFETYQVPAAVDPAAWVVQAQGQDRITLRTTGDLRLMRSRTTVRATIEKTVLPAADPLAEGGNLDSGLSYAGYTQRTVLEVELARAGQTVASVGLWSLLQLPQPGEMRVATWIEAGPRVVFGPLEPGELTNSVRLLRWRMEPGSATTKIAVKAGPLAGRAGYLWGRDGIWQLVVRQFGVWPGAAYIDGLWEPPHETGFAFQACAVRAGAESFSELEYHAPAVQTVASANRYQDESRVWAYRGSREAVEAAAHRLLGE